VLDGQREYLEVLDRDEAARAVELKRRGVDRFRLDGQADRARGGGRPANGVQQCARGAAAARAGRDKEVAK